MASERKPLKVGQWNLCRHDILQKDCKEGCNDRREFIEQFFAYDHLPVKLAMVSKPFSDLARHILTLPRNPQREIALQKLLEAKDAAVRAKLATE
jgi:hypothetical protein